MGCSGGKSKTIIALRKKKSKGTKTGESGSRGVTGGRKGDA